MKNNNAYNKLYSVVSILFSATMKKYPMFICISIIKALIEILQPFLNLFFTPLIIDELCGAKEIRKLILYAGILIFSEFLVSSFLEFINTSLKKYEERLNNFFTTEIGRQSMNLDFQLTEDKVVLDQLEKAKMGINGYSGGVYGISEQYILLFGNIIKAAGFVTIIAFKAPWLILVLLIILVFNGLITYKCNKIELESFDELSKTNRLFSYYGWNIVDLKFGKDIRLYNAKNAILNKWVQNTKTTNRAWIWQENRKFRYRKYEVIPKFVMNFITYLYVGILTIKGIISIGEFTQMIEATNLLDMSLGGIVTNVQEIFKRCNYAYEYVLFMEYPVVLEKNNDLISQGLHQIEFRNVSFKYPGTDKNILNNINISINPGEKLSIVGENGAGKTTFIKLLCRLYEPNSGEILLDGKNIKEYNYQEYMKQIAPVFQDFKLFGFTISENVYPKDIKTISSQESEKINQTVLSVGLMNATKKYNKGIDTTVFKIFDDNGVEPSGGEQQKIAIARALFKNSTIVVLDEPTAALDPIAEYDIYRQFCKLIGDKTAFYISHRLSSCRFCDKIAVFSRGEIIEYGSHDELVKNENGVYHKMYEAQAQYYR